jgi:hypothetical protein
MDTDRLLRIFGRMMETHGTLFISSLSAVLGLLLLVFIMRRLSARKAAKKASPMMSAPNMASDDADMLLIDDIEDDIGGEMSGEFSTDFAVDDDASIIADMQADTMMAAPAMGDDLDATIAHQFDDSAAEISDLDDITIPKIGEAPPPKQSRFFSSSWLHRKDKANAPTISLDMTPTGDAPVMRDNAAHKSAAECARLGDIERKLMALRELYEAGLIAPEVYVVKAREFAAQV